MSNFINYTGLTYDDIKSDIRSRLAEDSRFDNFRESALYSVITEIFAATTDFTNYYIERRAEESFLETAKLRSSIVLLSKMLGYIITRPIPATTTIKISIDSLPQGTLVGNTLELASGTTFTYQGNTYTLLQGLSYSITQDDINNFQNPSYSKELHFKAATKQDAGHIFDDNDSRSTLPITLVQCEKRTKTILNSTNTQMGKRYQTYSINDPEFSNIYGSEDYGTNSNDITLNGTRVGIGSTEDEAFCNDMSEFDSKREFWIDRRSFLNSDSIPQLSATGAGANVKYCVIRTSITDGVEVLFGDDNVSSVGAKNDKNVYIRYLATKGSKANTVGVVGKSIQCNITSYSHGFDKKNISFYLTSNITGGSDIEDVESIKVNSPEIFYSLERCVTPRDYVSYLKTLILSSKKVQNAIAWGEQEETRDNTEITNIKLFNVVLFSVLSDMYSKINDSTLGSIYNGVDSDDNVLVAPLTATDFDWFNTIVMSDSTTPLKNVQADEYAYPELKNVYTKLYERSQLTVKNVYVSPLIQDFDLQGTIYFNPLSDKVLAKKKIQNAIYSYLSNNADFNTPIYISTIIDIIESFSEVHHADVSFVPYVDDTLQTFTIYSSGTEIDSAFSTKPINYVYNTSLVDKSMFGSREYSTSAVKESVDIFKNILSSTSGCSAINSYTSESFEAIFCLIPKYEVKSYKYDSSMIASEIIWPSKNSYDTGTCSITTAITPTSACVSGYYPSERNLYLGMVKCFLNKLTTLSTSVGASSVSESWASIIEKYDEILNYGKCFCSTKDLVKTQSNLRATTTCYSNILGSNSSELSDFVDNYFKYFIDILRNTFSYVIRQYMIDSNGNISNFSMKNEIARVDLSNLVYSYK